MCRRNQVFAAALISFGAGLLTGLFIDSGLVALLLAAGAIVGGFVLLKMI